MNQIISSEKRLKKSVKRTHQKIKQTNLWSVFKEKAKVKKTKKDRIAEASHSLCDSVKETAQDIQVNMSLSMLKILKFKIFSLSSKNTLMELSILYRSYLSHCVFFVHHCKNKSCKDAYIYILHMYNIYTYLNF